MESIFYGVLGGVWLLGMGGYILINKKWQNGDKLHYYNYRKYCIKYKKINDQINEASKNQFK